jgi:NAD(P)-dependent dehydrogenase (short-subunit alcohol dehydrogenase family)
MSKRTLLVVGAAGDVGQGIVAEALASGRNAVAAGRDGAKLEALAARHAGAPLACVAGNLASEDGAEALWHAAAAAFGTIDEVVISVNSPGRVEPLAALNAADLAENYAANVLTHFIAAKVFLPRLPDSGMLIGIGGGTADFIFPRMAPTSMGQAALRMLYRGLAREQKTGAQLRELMIVSMVAGASNRESAAADWVTDAEVGRHVCAILDAPELFPKPILQLRSMDQVGRPEDEGKVT